jgi:diguanylate cyclase (GGDEF)-like protein
MGARRAGNTGHRVASESLPHFGPTTDLVTRLQRALDHERAARRDAEGRLERERRRHRRDELTGLPTRPAMLERIDAVATRAGRAPYALLCADIDAFARINDTLGHEVGDRVLRHVAARIRAVAPPGDAVGRLGDDAFVLVCEGMDTADAIALADRIREEVGRGVEVGALRVAPTVSIGVRVVTGRGAGPANALRDAEVAAQRAREAGRGRLEVFDEGVHAEIRERLRLERRLEQALDEGSLSLAYQPIVHPVTLQPMGYEALLRWDDPELGSVPPARFIPVAERTRQIVAIGEWVLTRALEDMDRAFGGSGRPRQIAVNVSPVQLHEPEFAAHVREALERFDVAPQRLVLEVTESLLVSDDEVVAHNLARLRQLGLALAIDDFGVGYSSLSKLSRLKAGILKIDRSFVSDISPASDGRLIVAAIIGMARGLGIATIAEGVERREQLDALRDMGIDRVQGFLLGRPAAPPGLEASAGGGPR